MAAFWNRQGTHGPCEKMFATLRAEIEELRSRVTSAERTVSECAEASYRQLKKAEQAARRALAAAEVENQEQPNRGDVPVATPLPPPLTGARARIAARRMRAAFPQFEQEPTNGVHP
jgi:hypothetical protein